MPAMDPRGAEKAERQAGLHDVTERAAAWFAELSDTPGVAETTACTTDAAAEALEVPVASTLVRSCACMTDVADGDKFANEACTAITAAATPAFRLSV